MRPLQLLYLCTHTLTASPSMTRNGLVSATATPRLDLWLFKTSTTPSFPCLPTYVTLSLPSHFENQPFITLTRAGLYRIRLLPTKILWPSPDWWRDHLFCKEHFVSIPGIFRPLPPAETYLRHDFWAPDACLGDTFCVLDQLLSCPRAHVPSRPYQTGAQLLLFAPIVPRF